jgi:hypothetical protein
LVLALCGRGLVGLVRAGLLALVRRFSQEKGTACGAFFYGTERR